MSIKWPNGKTIDKLAKDIRDNTDKILGGNLVAIDPASRSCGFARYSKGVLVNSGVITLPAKAKVQDRLRILYDTLFLMGIPDVLAIEKIRGRNAHVYLGWSVGVSVAAVRAPVVLEVSTTMWKACCPDDYIKSDENDGKMIGLAVIEYAKHLQGKT